MKSWRTSTAGVIGGICMVLAETCDLLGIAMEKLGTDGRFELDTLFAGAGLIWLGITARDNKVSSEDVGVAQ